MARGFESKDVEFQQSEAERTRHAAKGVVREPSPDERRAASSRATTQLALARARSDLEKALKSAHRQMLERAIGELERRLASP